MPKCGGWLRRWLEGEKSKKVVAVVYEDWKVGPGGEDTVGWFLASLLTHRRGSWTRLETLNQESVVYQ